VSQGTSRALTDLFARWGTRRAEETARPHDKSVTTTPTHEKTLSTKAFGKFLSALAHREAPVLLDLGPVVGTNINFFGERLGCKFFVEDFYANVEKFAKENRTTELAGYLASRFPQKDASFDGILCWDIFDYLDKRSAPILAKEMTRLLKPGGALLAFFATVAIPESEYTRFLVVDDKTFKHRSYPAARGRQQVLVNRDITRMFEGLNVWESFLLMTKTREIVFRKPEKKDAPSIDAANASGDTTTAAPSPAAAPAAAASSATPTSASATSGSAPGSTAGTVPIGTTVVGLPVASANASTVTVNSATVHSATVSAPSLGPSAGGSSAAPKTVRASGPASSRPSRSSTA